MGWGRSVKFGGRGHCEMRFGCGCDCATDLGHATFTAALRLPLPGAIATAGLSAVYDSNNFYGNAGCELYGLRVPLVLIGKLLIFVF